MNDWFVPKLDILKRSLDFIVYLNVFKSYHTMLSTDFVDKSGSHSKSKKDGIFLNLRYKHNAKHKEI